MASEASKQVPPTSANVRQRGAEANGEWWGVAEVAAYLDVSESTVYWWRKRGTGPKGIRVGRYVRYWSADVEAWCDARPRR